MVISMKRDDVVGLRNGFWNGLRDSLGYITIRCAYGTVWVTVAGQSSDYILSPGEELTVPQKGRVVIMAEENSALRLFRPVTPGALARVDLSAVRTNCVCQEMRSR